MRELEFYSYDDEVWCRFSDGSTEIVNEHSREIIDTLYDIVKSEYHETYEALSQIYKRSELNVPYYKYVVVKRFIKCNFSKVDTTYIDIDSFGGKERMNFEKVDCPMRGECPFEGIICQPRFSTSLTDREMTVARYWYDGKSKDEIAELMFLSPETVNNHIRRIYNKLGVHSEAEFVKYVDSKRIF
jgi:DNA-binding CsgD family transcriptional regulator